MKVQDCAYLHIENNIIIPAIDLSDINAVTGIESNENMFALYCAFRALCYTICMKENLIHYRTACVISTTIWYGTVKYRRKILNSGIEGIPKGTGTADSRTRGLLFIYLNVVKETMSTAL